MRPRETRQIVLNATPACGRFILEIGEPCPIQPTFVKIENFVLHLRRGCVQAIDSRGMTFYTHHPETMSMR
jgi:hypothetical protein